MKESAKRILLVEDEESIATSLKRFLESEGFLVSVECTFESAKTFNAPWDLCLLDWMLPDGQGIDLLRTWRAAGVKAPVIFLSARTEIIDKVLGLELGADDYITKPFEPRELLARMHVRLRSSETTDHLASDHIQHGPLIIDPRAMKVTFEGQERTLTKMEYELLKFLAEQPGKVFSRDEILEAVWGFEHFPTTRTVDTHILQLRQKFSPQLFETIRGVGYRFVSPRS
jgi:DNA-binding response OmpR family regulator